MQHCERCERELAEKPKTLYQQYMAEFKALDARRARLRELSEMMANAQRTPAARGEG